MKKSFKKILVFVLLSSFFNLNYAKANPLEKTAKSAADMVTAIPKGTVNGAGRGVKNHSNKMTGAIGKKLGFGFLGRGIGRIVSAPVALLSGSVAGGVSGTAKGALDGAKIGVKDPVIRGAAVGAASAL